MLQCDVTDNVSSHFSFNLRTEPSVCPPSRPHHSILRVTGTSQNATRSFLHPPVGEILLKRARKGHWGRCPTTERSRASATGSPVHYCPQHRNLHAFRRYGLKYDLFARSWHTSSGQWQTSLIRQVFVPRSAKRDAVLGRFLSTPITSSLNAGLSSQAGAPGRNNEEFHSAPIGPANSSAFRTPKLPATIHYLRYLSL